MAKSYDMEEVKALIRKLSRGNPITYEELRENHGKPVAWARRYLKFDRGSRQMIDRLLRRCIEGSIREMEREEEPLGVKDVRKKNDYLHKLALELYPSSDGKSHWQALLESAGIDYEHIFKPRRRWDLKKLLREISRLDDSIACRPSHLNAEDSGFVRYGKERFGTWGKAVMLAGIDYLDLPRVQEERHVFTVDDVRSVAHDKSIDYETKAACLFNALSLQYYEFCDGSAYGGRRIDEKQRGYRTCDETTFFGRPSLILRHKQHDTRMDRFAVSLELRRAENKFHRTNFHFAGERAGAESRDMYSEMCGMLSFCRLPVNGLARI